MRSRHSSDGSPAMAVLVALLIVCLLELWLGSIQEAERLHDQLNRLTKQHGKTNDHFIGAAD